MASFTILLPSIHHPRAFEQQLGELYRQWAEVRNEREFWQPVNIRFEHNPEWRDKFASMTCIGEGRHWFWRVTKIAFMGQMAGVPFLLGAAVGIGIEAYASTRRQRT